MERKKTSCVKIKTKDKDSKKAENEKFFICLLNTTITKKKILFH